MVGIFWGLAETGMGTCSAQEPAYQMDFEKIEAGKVPEEFLVLDGAFGVREESGNRFLELPGAPLETFGTLFGPTAKDGLKVGARIFGTSKGRRFPVMGVGLNGAVPLRLQVTPSKKALELFKGDDLLTSTPFQWSSGAWTEFRLQLVKVKDGEWKLSGKAWKQGESEPETWTLTHGLSEAPAGGRASIWGKPFAETPIRFDNLAVWKLP
ncbi:MAG: hypothetical protein JNN07_10875 [Verrucomicrobiales bacterium]|nr:hypothetical protein [Verrucomicrobiales bacterium]